MLHRAHLQWLKEERQRTTDVIEMNEFSTPFVTVWTLPERVRLYEGKLALLVRDDIPEELKSTSLVRNSFLYNNGPPIEQMFKQCKINPRDVIHGWRGLEWKSMDCYKNKMIFKPFESHQFEMKEYHKKFPPYMRDNKKNIVIIPRFKLGDPYTEKRNWGIDNWKKLYDFMLHDLGEDINIIICGRYGQSYYLKEHRRESINLISDNPFPMLLATLNDPNTILTVSSQSFGGKLALLQNVDTIMFGHQRERHSILENWSSDSNVECIFKEDMEYNSTPEEIFGLITDFLERKNINV